MAPGRSGSDQHDDFAEMFDVLDLSRRGYLTMEEIQKFYESIFYKPVNDAMVRSVLRDYGGNAKDTQCTKKSFEIVLSKLEEKKNLEESTYWDFIALDRDGTRLVNVKSCLLLAKSVNSDFGMSLWHDWLNSRVEPNAPISWFEFQKYLYFTSDRAGEVSDAESAFDNEMQSLTKNEVSDMDKKYTEFKGIFEDDEDYLDKLQQDRNDYQDNIRYESSRLLNRWDIGGAEAVIYDDGTEMERQIVESDAKNSVTITDLFSALDVKYGMLREKILMEMAKSSAEVESSGSDQSATVEKLLHDIRKKEKKARKMHTLDEMLSIQGASVQHRFTALAVMGETADAYIAKWEKAEGRFKVLRSEGKSTDEINKLYENEILNEMRGSTTNGELLIHLAKRQEEEKAYISKSLQFLLPIQSVAERLAIYASLHRQCLRAEKHEAFENAAVSACLAERKQLTDFEKYNPDCSRQEKLSKLHLDFGTQEGLGQRVPEAATPEVSHSKKLGMVDSWLEVTRLLSQKHAAERKVMAHFLLSDKINSDLESLKNESQKNLQVKRHQMTKQLEHMKENLSAKGNAADKAQRRSQYFDILSSASALYWENIRRSGNVDKAATTIFARIQVLQDVESEAVFLKMRKMHVAEIYQLRKELYRSIRDEAFENISELLLGAVKISSEEKELVDLILLKYNKLRVKLFENFVKKKKIDTEVARNQLMDKLKIGEEKHRLAGNHAKLAKLSGDTFQIKYTLQEIMGPDASRYKQEANHFLEELKDSGRKRKLINEPPDLGDITDSTTARGNAISELHLRYEDEIDMILDSVRESSPAEKAFFIAAEMAWQQWEILRFNLDDEFIPAALAMGLSERTKIGQGKIKLRQDNTRYIRLAQERLMTSTSLNTKSLQSISTSPTPAQSSLRRVLLCHASDWRKLYELLTDESAEELREAARSMSDDERTSRLAEINAKRMALDTKSQDWQDDILALLEEAAAIKYVSRMQNLKQLGGAEMTITQSDVQVSIMADLQEEHDKDGFKWFNMALEDPEAAGKIKDLAMSESKSCVNIFNVLCKYEGQTDDDELLQALEDKYDSLRDKLLAEALMKQLGEKAWREMTERERQERIFKMKMEERRLRKEGRYDELAKLLGDAFADDERLRALLGMNKDEYDRKLQERLANRKRGELGAIAEDEAEMAESDGDPLVDLTSRYEEERDALMRMLAGQGDRYMSERDRQMELARLRRELRKSEREERFGAAALVLGLAERNAEMEERLASDKKRQEELAKQRLAELRAKRSKALPMSTLSEDDENIVKSGNKTEMIDAVLGKLELLYEAERAWLVHILLSQNQLKPDQIGVKQNNPMKHADAKNSNELSERLHEIGLKIPKQVNVNQYKMPLTEAGFFRQALFVHELRDLNEKEIDKEILDTKTLAFLQDIQDMGGRKIIDKMASMNNEELIELQELYLSWIKQGISENIYSTFFSTFVEEDLVTKAFDGEFDAILAALVEKALIEKKGEKKWNSLSQPERDRLVAETMEKIKKLIAEGKTDEAAALLGDAANIEDILKMFGLKTNEEENERLERERLERRKQRIADGMSEEEADRLMEEERLRDEELLKKRRQNVLDLLKFDLDAQKAALMKQMEDSNEQLEAERRRQLELARLRLQQRMMQRENDVNAVAHVLALSKMATDQLEAEKQRQRALARQRLEAYKKGRGSKEEKMSPLKLPDGDDVDSLIDTIVQEMESKHAEERRILMQLMSVDAAPGTEVRNKLSSKDSESMNARLKELHELRRQWRNDDPENLAENAQEQMKILIEATALNLEVLKKESKHSEESAQEDILAKLQNHQMLESSHLINDLPGKNASTLRVIAQVQWKARSEKWYDNVAESLLQKTAITSEEQEVLKAVDEKYDLMRDKLIAEALMRQMGEKDWNDLSELERQKNIIALKLKERKLRQEGKMDEAAQLISSLIKSDEELARLLGESKLSQKEEIERKLEQRRKLKEERLAAGLLVDDNTMDEEMEKIDEEEKKKRKNVLLLLEHNLDEERDAILASLRKQDEVVGAERRRQLELARLRREQKQIAREDKVNAAAIIFNQAKKSEELLAASLAENRARQLALAKERLASRKQRKEDREAARALFDIAAITKKLESLEKKDQDDSASAPERLLAEIDAGQVSERENLFLLLLSTEMDSEMRMQVSSMTNEQIKAEKDKIVKNRQDWREKRFVDLLQGKEEQDVGKKTRRRESLAKSIAEQNTNFKRYMILQLEAEMRAKSDKNLDFAAVKNEMSVTWLSEAQTSQATSVDAVHTLIADKSDEVLDMITYGQRKSRMESWNDNLNKVVMGILPPGQIDPIERQVSSLSTGSDEKNIEDTEKQMKGLDEELEEQKKDLEKRKKIGEDIDLESAMAKLQQQHEAKKQALASDLDRQKQKIQERLAARRQQRDELVYEAHAAAALVFAAERRLKDQEASQLEQKSRQKSMMEEKLEARKKRRKELEASRLQEEEAAANNDATPKKSKMAPPMGLKREKTVIDVQYSNEDKEKMLKEMRDISEKMSAKLEEDRKRHIDYVQNKIQARADKKHDKVEKIFANFEREKTIVLEKKNQEFQRQKTMLQDRMQNIRTGKTKTMKESSDKKVREFDELVNADESKGMSHDERMALAAQNLEKKFLAEKSSDLGDTASKE